MSFPNCYALIVFQLHNHYISQLIIKKKTLQTKCVWQKIRDKCATNLLLGAHLINTNKRLVNNTDQEADVLLPHLICLHWALVHVKVPHLGGEVVSGQQIASTVAELDVRHRGNDL